MSARYFRDGMRIVYTPIDPCPWVTHFGECGCRVVANGFDAEELDRLVELLNNELDQRAGEPAREGT